MTIMALLFGLIAGFFPMFFFFRFYKGKVLFIENTYMKGALLGFLIWVVINILLYFEARYNLVGVLAGEEGFGTMILLTSSLPGFITAGIAAAFASQKLQSLKKKDFSIKQ
jgi:hypothetical protein